MCGIAGILDRDGRPIDRAALDRLLDAIAHRGPDGRGTWIADGIGLGHVRLSILDPSPAGAQPMLRDGAVLVHNGEVYDFLELARRLDPDGQPPSTDTEVILAAWRAWGPDLVRRFNGMFAFALWDPGRRRLLLARDRLGVKPLYIRRVGRLLAFASEARALVAARPLGDGDDAPLEPDQASVHDFLTRGRTDTGEATFFDGVRAVPPGHVLIVDDDVERLIRWWGPPELSDDDRPTRAAWTPTDRRRDAAAVDDLRDRFDRSVRLRLRSDVPLGTCLSGGLDSSSIAITVATLLESQAAERREQVPRIGFHARYPESGIDESRYARLAAERAGIELTYAARPAADLLAEVIAAVRIQGEPYGGGSIHAQLAVMAAVADAGLKVVLDGQGADELLGGYVHYAGVRTVGIAASGHPLAAAEELRAQVGRRMLGPAAALGSAAIAAAPDAILEALRGLSGGRLGIPCREPLAGQPLPDEPPPPAGTRLARHLWRATTTSLSALLRYEDRASMAFGVEARVPFLDVNVVECAMRLPDRLRIDGGVTKVALRRAMAGRVPDAILERRDKLGFAAPQRAWLEADRAAVRALLAHGQLVERGWVASEVIRAIVDADLSRRRPSEQLWRLLVTETWLRLNWAGRRSTASDPVWADALERAPRPSSHPRAGIAA